MASSVPSTQVLVRRRIRDWLVRPASPGAGTISPGPVFFPRNVHMPSARMHAATLTPIQVVGKEREPDGMRWRLCRCRRFQLTFVPFPAKGESQRMGA